jgi:hypothetical protein
MYTETPVLRGCAFMQQHSCILQGNCSLEPPTSILENADLRAPVKPGQCVLGTNLRLMNVQQSLWLDSLYITHNESRRSDPESLLACFGKQCNLWLTGVTLEGTTSNRGLDVKGGQAYAEGVHAGHFLVPVGCFKP